MKIETIMQACDTLQNGNITEFKAHLKKCSKLDVMRTVEYLFTNYEMSPEKAIHRVLTLL